MRARLILPVLGLMLLGAQQRVIADEGTTPFRGGMALSMHSSDPEYSYVPALREIRELGATDVSILFHIYQDNSISAQPKRHGFKTPSDRIFLEAIKESQRLGMRVLVMPIVLLEKPRDNDWRGNLQPPSWNTWRAGYLSELKHFARLAEKGGANIFAVGSELSSTEHHDADWRAIIKEVRAVFSGLVTYSSNWDHYDEVPFWDALDFMGISGYYELTNSLTPTLAELKASWRSVQLKIMSWRNANAVKAPLIFTEVGYASQDGCASKPWNYYLSKQVDLEEQRLCYEAFLAVWEDHPRLAGVYFYEWWGKGGPGDTRYTPRGKPAAKLLRRWYRGVRKRNARARVAAKPAPAPTKPETTKQD